MSNVFLSHSHADKPFVRKMAGDLRIAGHGIWIDEAEIQIGDSLVEKIREGLDQVDYVIAVLSSASISSEWVNRELDIATNREIDEKRVVVLPILFEDVELPGFLKGKFYGNFIDEHNYQNQLDLLLRKLGAANPIKLPSNEELEILRANLQSAQEVAEQQIKMIGAIQAVALHGKSEKLKDAILAANNKFPLHAPINLSHAFEALSQPITLDYLFWAIEKTKREGSHPLAVAITLDEKWPAVSAMLNAYKELLDVLN
jgi:hypothetical protein